MNNGEAMNDEMKICPKCTTVMTKGEDGRWYCPNEFCHAMVLLK